MQLSTKLIAVFFFISFFFVVVDAKAQTCSGSYTCCNAPLVPVCNCPLTQPGNICGCGTSPKCQSTTFLKSCSFWGSPPNPAPGVCDVYFPTCNYVSGGCAQSGGGGGGGVCGDGSCNNGETNASCPGDCPSGGGGGGYGACGSCSGCPGGNNSQCRTDPGGACVWDPSACGGGGGVAACQLVWQSLPGTVVVGTSKKVTIFFNGGLSSWIGTWSHVGAAHGFFVPVSSTGAQYTTMYNATVVGAGTIKFFVHDSGQNQDCVATAPVSVIPAPPPPPVCASPVITVTPQCSLTLGGNASVSFQWNYVANADLYHFYVVDKNTGTTIAGTDTGFVAGNSATFNFCNAAGTTCTRVVNLPQGATDYEGRVVARSSTGLCSDSVEGASNSFVVFVCPASAWWQAANGDVITQGSITSLVPSTVTSPDNRISQDGSGGYPGVVLVNSSGAVDPGSGTVSSTNWSVGSAYLGREPLYDDFVTLIPSSVTPSDPGGTPNGATFSSAPAGAADSSGYVWYKHDGNMTISGDIVFSGATITRKAILFVNGNLTIGGKITVDPAQGFFMILVKGNISVDPSVTAVSPAPALTGVFYSEGSFLSGTGGARTDSRLNVLGSVAALGGVVLQRDLGDVGNRTQSAEVFGLSPELLQNYPFTLTFKRPIWREVAP